MEDQIRAHYGRVAPSGFASVGATGDRLRLDLCVPRYLSRRGVHSGALSWLFADGTPYSIEDQLTARSKAQPLHGTCEFLETPLNTPICLVATSHEVAYYRAIYYPSSADTVEKRVALRPAIAKAIEAEEERLTEEQMTNVRERMHRNGDARFLTVAELDERVRLEVMGRR